VDLSIAELGVELDSEVSVLKESEQSVQALGLLRGSELVLNLPVR
jgi:hypothetical protein